MSCAALEPITNPRHFKSRGLGQAYALREFAWEGMTALKLALTDKTSGKVVIARSDARDIVSAICGMMKSWELADDRIRIHRGKPLPGSLRPAPKASKQKRKPDSLEPLSKIKPKPVEPASCVSLPPIASASESSTPQVQTTPIPQA